jgi:hypothetical protein
MNESDILSDAYIEEMKHSRTLYRRVIENYAAYIADIDAQLAAHEAAVFEQEAEIMPGDLCVITPDAMVAIRRVYDTPLDYVSVGAILEYQEIGHVHDEVYFTIPVDKLLVVMRGRTASIVKAMRRAYLAREVTE